MVRRAKKSVEQESSVSETITPAQTSVVQQEQQIIPPPVILELPQEQRAKPLELKSSNQDGVWVRLSTSLRKKLEDQAGEEGISFEEYISELLAESVVLRAWEIAEKKALMRGGPAAQANHGLPRSNGNHHGHRNQKMGGNQPGNNQNNRRNLNQQRYNNLMEDKAAFLEYVRNQERNQR